MTLRTASIWLAITAAIFVACCSIMLLFGHEMEEAVIIYPFMAAWGGRALAWPLFAMFACRAAFSSLWLRYRRRGRNDS